MNKFLVASILGASLLGANAGVSHAQTPTSNADNAGQNSNNCIYSSLYKQAQQAQQEQQTPQAQQDDQGQNGSNCIFSSLYKKHFEQQIQQQLQKQLQQLQQAQQSQQVQPVQPAQPTQQAQPAAPQQNTQAPSKAPSNAAPSASKQSTAGLTADEKQMLNLVNQERAKAGVPALKVDPALTKMATVKAKDMINNGYFSHQSPTYGSPFDMMKKFGISFRTAGENIAGNQTVQAAHTALMNSQGHRENILNPNYTSVGIGIVNGGPYGKMFVQDFKG